MGLTHPHAGLLTTQTLETLCGVESKIGALSGNALPGNSLFCKVSYLHSNHHVYYKKN